MKASRKMHAKTNFVKAVRGSKQEIEARKVILQHFKSAPLPDDEILTNLGLYLRSTIVSKILYLNELYQHIIPLPGIIIEFGSWWGSNLALFQSLRSVYEPYNWQRKVVGFDTFTGYPSVSPMNGTSMRAAVGGYSLTKNWERRLDELLDAHERDNVMGHLKKHELVKGDVVRTIGQYLKRNPETIIALAYFDLALYKPTRKCLQTIRPNLIPGSVLAMDELNSADFPGETLAFRESFQPNEYLVRRSSFLPDRSIVIIK